MKSNKNNGTGGMWRILWKTERIVAQVPPASPGNGDSDETFRVRIFKAGNNTDTPDFEATPVVVIGPVGGYPIPPVHLLVPELPLVVPVG